MHLAPHYLLCCDNSFLANKVFNHVLLSLFNCAMESTDGKNGTNNHFIVSIDLHCTINLFWLEPIKHVQNVSGVSGHVFSDDNNIHKWAV